jgi:hypothetical protein
MTTMLGYPSNSPGATRGCGRDDCEPDDLGPVSVFCRTHGALLVLRRLSLRVRYALGAAACVLTALAFYFAPIAGNSLPIFFVLAGAGLAVTGLPLRHFPVAGRSAVAGWAVACGLSFVLTHSHGSAFRPVLTVVALVVAAGWATRLSQRAITTNKAADSIGGIPGAPLIAACLGVAAGASVLRFAGVAPANSGGPWVAQLLVTPMTWLAWMAVIFIAFALCGFAAIHSVTRWTAGESRLIATPRRPDKLASVRQPSRSVRRRSVPDRLLDGLTHNATQLVLAVIDLLVYVLYYWTLRILVGVANWLLLWFAAIVDIAIRAARLWFLAARNATRMVVVPAAGLVLGAVLVRLTAEADVKYVVTGSRSNLGLVLGFAAVAYFVLTLAWTALSALPIREVADTVMEFTVRLVAVTLIGILFGGWIFGILGFFGYGVYAVGLVTLVCTGLVVLLVVVRGLRARFHPLAEEAGWHAAKLSPEVTP